MSLETLVARIDRAEKLSTANLEGWDARTRPSIEIAKRSAADELVKLKKEYGVVVKEGLAVLFLAGSPEDQKQFAEITEDEVSEALVIDGCAMAKRLADKVRPGIGGDKQFTAFHMYTLITEVQDIMRELEIADWIAPTNIKNATVLDEEGLIALMSYQMEQIGGLKTLAAYLTKQIVEAAIAARYINSVVPVLITGLTAAEREAVKGIANTSLTVELPSGKQINKDTVIKAFLQLKKKITKK